MFRNVTRRNDANVFTNLVTANKDWNLILPKTRSCPILLNIDQRLASNSTLISTAFYSYDKPRFSQMNIRSKGTVAKEDSPTKKEESRVDVKIDSKVLTRGEKLKKAVKEYGSTVIVFHVGISLISLGTCYLIVSSGVDVTKLFAMLGLEEWATKSQFAASAGTFAVAYAVHKVFAPARIAITLTSVPLIVRYLRRIGFLKK